MITTISSTSPHIIHPKHEKENIFDPSTSYTRRPLPLLPPPGKPSSSASAKFTNILQRVQVPARLNLSLAVADCRGDLSEAIKSLGSSLGVMVKTDFIDLDGKNSPRKSKGSRPRFYHHSEASASEETIRGVSPGVDVSTIRKKHSPNSTSLSLPSTTPSEPDWFDSLREWEQSFSGAPKTSWDEDEQDDEDALRALSAPLFSSSLGLSEGASLREEVLDPENAFWSSSGSRERVWDGEEEKYERPGSRQGFFV